MGPSWHLVWRFWPMAFPRLSRTIQIGLPRWLDYDHSAMDRGVKQRCGFAAAAGRLFWWIHQQNWDDYSNRSTLQKIEKCFQDGVYIYIYDSYHLCPGFPLVYLFGVAIKSPSCFLCGFDQQTLMIELDRQFTESNLNKILNLSDRRIRLFVQQNKDSFVKLSFTGRSQCLLSSWTDGLYTGIPWFAFGSKLQPSGLVHICDNMLNSPEPTNACTCRNVNLTDARARQTHLWRAICWIFSC